MQRGGRERETLGDAAAVKKSKALCSARCFGDGRLVLSLGAEITGAQTGCARPAAGRQPMATWRVFLVLSG